MTYQMCKYPSFVTLATPRFFPVRQDVKMLGKMCFCEENLSRLKGLPYLPRSESSSLRVVLPPAATRRHIETLIQEWGGGGGGQT